MRLLDEPRAELEVLDRYDAFTDNPVPFLFKELDSRFRGAKFILTTRSLDSWLRSMEWLFGEGLDRLDQSTRTLGDEVHERLYGITTFDANVLTEIHTRHHASVVGHFESRPRDLLTLPVGDLGWQRLCRFLDVAEPTEEFPHANKSERDAALGWRRRFW